MQIAGNSELELEEKTAECGTFQGNMVANVSGVNVSAWEDTWSLGRLAMGNGAMADLEADSESQSVRKCYFECEASESPSQTAVYNGSDAALTPTSICSERQMKIL